MRQLNVIPIVHTSKDLGRLEHEIDAMKRVALPSASIDASKLGVDAFWVSLRAAIIDWEVEFARLVVFQDALPVAPNPSFDIERRIVMELASKGSHNHRLLQWLMDQGATLMGTESPELLMEEYRLVRKMIEEGETSKSDDSVVDASTILEKRDRFIAKRIGESLSEEQVGLLFIGLLHQVEPFLAEDIQVCYPFGKPRSVSTDLSNSTVKVDSSTTACN